MSQKTFLNSSCKWNELKDKKEDESSQPKEASAMSRERETLTHEMPADGWLPQETMQKSRLKMNYSVVSEWFVFQTLGKR